MKIIPIAITNINWEGFVTNCQSFIGRSPTRSLDNNNLPTGSIDSFLSALNEFRHQGSNPREINELTFNHVSISFLMLIDNWAYYSLLEHTHKNIHIIKAYDNQENKYQEAIIMTGTLKEWIETILEYKDYPEFSITIWEILHKMGFGKVFTDYKINAHNYIEKR